jgi:hypothetical protein
MNSSRQLTDQEIVALLESLEWSEHNIIELLDTGYLNYENYVNAQGSIDSYRARLRQGGIEIPDWWTSEPPNEESSVWYRLWYTRKAASRRGEDVSPHRFDLPRDLDRYQSRRMPTLDEYREGVDQVRERALQNCIAEDRRANASRERVVQDRGIGLLGGVIIDTAINQALEDLLYNDEEAEEFRIVRQALWRALGRESDQSPHWAGHRRERQSGKAAIAWLDCEERGKLSNNPTASNRRQAQIALEHLRVRAEQYLERDIEHEQILPIP